MTVANHTCSLIHSFTITFVTPFFCTPCPHRVPEPLGVRRDFLTCQAYPSIDVQHLVCASLFWRYWHILKLWKIGKSIRPANTTQYGKTEFLASQNSARIPNEPVEMQSQEPKGPKKLQNFAEMAKLVYHQNELAHLAAPNGHKLSQLMQF